MDLVRSMENFGCGQLKLKHQPPTGSRLAAGNLIKSTSARRLALVLFLILLELILKLVPDLGRNNRVDGGGNLLC